MNPNQLFETILRLYPRAFRERFEPELRALYSSQTDSSRGEQTRFLVDLFLGGMAERLQSTIWVRVATAFGFSALWVYLAGVTVWTLGQDQVAFWASGSGRWFSALLQSPVLALVDFGWLLLPFALVSRLQRPPTRLEWWSVFALMLTILASVAASWISSDLAFRQFFGLLFYLSVSMYCLADLRGLSPILKMLKAALLVNAVALTVVTLLPPATLASNPVWNAFRLAVILVIIVGLLVNDKPRATATPATRG